MIIKILYSDLIDCGYCVKGDSIALLNKRHCGTKIQGHYFVSIHEIFYLMNYGECWVFPFTGMEIEEMLKKDIQQWITDPVEMLNYFKPDANILSAYMHIRNMDLFLRFHPLKMNIIKEQLLALQTKKIQIAFEQQITEYTLYHNLKDYNSNINGLPLHLATFDSDTGNIANMTGTHLIGLMENGDVKLVKLQDFII